ncbi:MAG: TrkA family potassium uptake protein [Halobacteriales archaeon]
MKVIVGVLVFVVVLSVLYHTVMIRFEERSPDFSHSMQVTVEILTGSGFGSDSPWKTEVANLLVMAMDLSTFLVLFLVFPYLFQPILENAFSPSVPTTVDIDDHVVLCGVPRQTNQFVEELLARDISVTVISPRESDALDLMNEDIVAIHGDPTSIEALHRANITRARSVVVDLPDERAASTVLAVTEAAPELETFVVIDHLDHDQQLQHAGADRIITPRNLLGQRLAERVLCMLDPARSDTISLGGDTSLLELAVGSNENLIGTPIAEFQAMTQASVVGIWTDGEFLGSPADDTVLTEHDVLLLSGPDDSLAELEKGVFKGGEANPTVIVAGHGMVGSTVREQLERSGVTCRVIDTEEGAEVDVVGDATAPETLERAGLSESDVLVLALPDDDLTVLSVLFADESPGNPDVIARMNAVENETKIRRAGADYVLGVTTITGRLLSGEVFQENVLGFDRQIRIDRIVGDLFTEQRLDNVDIAESGCVLVGVERGGTFHPDPPAEFEVRSDDQLLIVGSDEAVGQVQTS